MTDKVTSYHQARRIVEQVNGGMPTATEGGENAEYYHVPTDPNFAMLDDCDWYVNKKTGKAERLYSSPIVPNMPNNMYHHDFKRVGAADTA